MLHRLLLSGLFLLLLSIPAAGVNLYTFPHSSLERAAESLKNKEYERAREAALSAPQGGVRDFLAGMSASKLGKWEEAAELLSRASVTFPLLADYALFNQGHALWKLSRYAEARTPFQTLLKRYPDSPLFRQAFLLLGDTLYAEGNFKEAAETYEKFIERYPNGNDSLTALYTAAQCREQLGDLKGAGATLRNIWLSYPTAEIAAKAETDLQRLQAKGLPVPPYTSEELFKRGVILFDLRKYDQALKTFTTIQKETQSADLSCRIAIKSGEALYRSRRCKEAEQTLAGLNLVSLRQQQAAEVLYWLGRSLDRNGKYDQAVATFLKLADTYPGSDLADNALMEAALVKRGERKTQEMALLLNRLLSAYPQSNLKQGALWELAWSSYRDRSYATAAQQFRNLLPYDSIRDKALYWLGHAETAAGNTDNAKTAFTTLLAEYPYGYYSTMYRRDAKIAPPSLPVVNRQEKRAPPALFDRGKALIAFGLHDEAKKELSSLKRSGKSGIAASLADMYLEMGDYNGAYSVFASEAAKPGKGTLPWNIVYPLAFSDHVNNHAAKNQLPPSLVYSIIRAESSYSPTALSPVGAVGLMQLMPATATAVAKNGTVGREKLVQPAINISLGTKHLRDLIASYDDDIVAAVAAYNAGSGNVNKWRKNLAGLPPDEFIESIPFGETREYVKKVLTAAEIYRRLYSLDVQAQPVAAPAEVSPDKGTNLGGSTTSPPSTS